MTPTAVVVISDLITVVFAIGSALISIGVKMGEVRGDIKYIREQLAELRGVFELKPRQL